MQLFVSILKTSILSTLNVFLIAGTGVWLSCKGVIDSSASIKIAQVIAKVLLPCLLFSKVSESISVEGLKVFWILPVSALVYVTCGIAVSALLLHLLCVPKALRPAVVCACGLANSQGLPIVLVASIAEHRFSPAEYDRAVSCISMYLVALSVLMWTIAPAIMRQPTSYEELDESVPQEQSVNPVEHEAPNNAWGKVSLVVSSLLSKVGRLLSPPVIGVFGGCAVGLSPLHGLLIRPNAPLRTIWSAASIIGSATIPMSMILIGSHIRKSWMQLKERGSSSLVHIPSICIGVFVRFVVMPGIGQLVWRGWLSTGLLPPPTADPMISLILLIESFMPTANNVIMISHLFGRNPEFASLLLFSQYLVSPIFLTANVAVALLSIS